MVEPERRDAAMGSFPVACATSIGSVGMLHQVAAKSQKNQQFRERPSPRPPPCIK